MYLTDFIALAELENLVSHTKLIIETSGVGDIVTTRFVRYFSLDGQILAQLWGCDINVIQDALDNPSLQNDSARQEITRLQDEVNRNKNIVNYLLARQDPNYTDMLPPQTPKFPVTHDSATPLGKNIADMLTRTKPKF